MLQTGLRQMWPGKAICVKARISSSVWNAASIRVAIAKVQHLGTGRRAGYLKVI